MLDDEDSVRDALRGALGPESQAPPSVTRIDDALRDVVAEGRRRVLGQRLAAAIGVVAVVGVVAFAATALGGRSVSDRVSSATGPTVITATSAPASTSPPIMTTAPGGDTALLPGWQWARMKPVAKGGTCVSPQPPVSTGQFGSLPPQPVVQQTLVSAVLAVDPHVNVTLTRSVWRAHDPKNGGPLGYLSFDVTDAAGPGAVDLQVQRYVGTPHQAADLDAFAYGSCAEPQRRVLPDGTVLQLYPYSPSADRRQPTRYLRIYLPNGYEYIIGDLGWGSVDLRPVNGDPAGAETVVGGRGSVPLDAAQLAGIAYQVAALR